MSLYEEQLKLQSQTIAEFEEKINKDIKRKSKNSDSVVKDTFQKKYLKQIAQNIYEVRNENLPKVIEKIYISDKYKKEICSLYGKENLKDSNLKAKAKGIAQEIQEIVNNKTTYSLKKGVTKRVYEILKEKNISLDESLKELNLKQKDQKFALATVLLTSAEVAWITLMSIANLLQKDMTSEDDNSTSQQAIINNISEELFNQLQFKYKKEDIDIQEWENDVEIDIGAYPFKLLMEYGVLEEYEKQGGYINLELSQEFLKDTKNIYNSMLKFMPPSFEPMIVKPTDWTSIDDGGFLKDENSSPKFDLYIMKSTTKRDKQNVKSRRDGFSPKLLEAVNIIQDTKWQINSDVLIDIEIFLKREKSNSKEKMKEFEKIRKEKYAIKEDGQTAINAQKEILEEMDFDTKDISEKLKQKYQVQKIKNRNYQQALKDKNKLKSDINLKDIVIKKANKYKKYKDIYFVWQVDFRGRVYPAQALLNPQGDDFAKSLLRFATKKSLGERGEKWFKIHGANLYGQDKISFDDRVQWVDEHQEEILGIFDNAYKFDNKFLNKADKPFSFLAFAYEYKEFIDNPKSFKSAIPIAMDGSNNGFQHITALLRDKDGAKKVNVIPEENQKVPSDIYKDVADKTKELIDADSKYEIKKDKKNFIVDKKYIDEIYEHITRSLTKKNVMTEVYGAGKGAKLQQIKEYIEDKLNDELKWDYDIIDDVSQYLRNMIAKAMKEELSSSDIYKKWIKNIAKDLSAQNKEIRWTTPIIKLEVIQEEFKTKDDKVSITYQGKKREVQIQIPTAEISKDDQIRGIAPNFTHSLDATHLFLTLLESKKHGVESFATIHDSFGTHACDVHVLLKATKTSFIDMFNEDILEKLKNEIEESYNIELRAIKKQGNDENFGIDDVLESDYFFS